MLCLPKMSNNCMRHILNISTLINDYIYEYIHNNIKIYNVLTYNLLL